MPKDSLQSDKTVLNLNQLDNLSLRYDLLTGWKPQLGIKNPFPLYFSDPFTESLRAMSDFVYKGVRHRHSYELHKAFSVASGYTVSQESFRMFLEAEIKGLLFHKSVQPVSKPDKLIFDSFFECGNCDLVRLSTNRADLYDSTLDLTLALEVMRSGSTSQ